MDEGWMKVGRRSGKGWKRNERMVDEGCKEGWLKDGCRMDAGWVKDGRRMG